LSGRSGSCFESATAAAKAAWRSDMACGLGQPE
jgi:hypothetical protein